MAEFFTIKCYDIIDLLLWGLLPFAIGIDIGVALHIITKHHNKRKGVGKNEKF